jgi:heat-inducible transcriptional repressor
MELGDRKKAILRAIINDYIQTAEPIGSRTIAKKHEIGISSATIRNEMADLEELGYLEQPHTSAGRIPSDKGYRIYVNELMELGNLTREETDAVKSILQLATINEIDKVIRRTTRLISELTKYTSAVLSPSVNASTLRSVQLVQISINDLIGVIVTDTAMVKNVMIRLPRPISGDTLHKINNMLNEKLVGLTIKDIDLGVISSIQTEMGGYTEIFNAVIPALYESLKTTDCDIYLEGTTNIFNYPEYNDIGKAKNFLSLIEQKDVLKELFFEDNKDISVTIGAENEDDKVKDCSIIKASYNISGRPVGTIGVIGPTRMNYSRVIRLLLSLSETLNSILKSSIDNK